MPLALHAQAPCAADLAHARLFSENADYRAAHDALEKSILHSTLKTAQQPSGAEFSPPLAPLVLPVVFHIVHQNGPENLSDTQVEAALAHLNAAFSHTGYFAQQGAGADALIQFCLARQTPDGQSTSGITRTLSPLTDMTLETQDLALKNLSRWNPKQYVNIWLVRGINSTAVGPSVGGYAYLPAAHGLPYDGIVVEADGLGSKPSEAADLVHEMGHYLGLYHTFEGGCANADCLSDGDRVCDTPPDRATGAACSFNSCSTDADDASPSNPFAADVDDFGWNFMDYSPQTCYSGFTAGQSLRMRLAVEGARKSLLASKGCVEPCPVPLTAAFAVADSSVTAGTGLIFSNLSAGATQFSWYDNGSLFSNATTPAPYAPAGTGIRTLRLVVGNGDPRCADTTEVLVSVACNITAAIVASDTAVDVGQSVTFTAQVSGATNFTWTVDGAVVSGAASFSQVFTQNGYAVVGLLAANSFCSIPVTLTLAVGSVCPEYLYREYDRSAVGSSGLSILRPRTLEPTRDGGFVIGGYVLTKGASLTKSSASGVQEWQRNYLGISDIRTAEQTPDGGYLLTGVTSAPQSIGFAMKCDATGQVLWAKQFPGTKNGTVLAAVCQAGGYFLVSQRLVSGFLLEWKAMRLDVDGNLLWSLSQTDQDQVVEMQGTEDGGVVMAKTYNSLTKLDQNGNLVFHKRYDLGGNYFLQAARRVMDVDGNDVYLISGWDHGFLWKTDAMGEVVWARRSDYYSKMAVLPGEGVLVCKDNQFSKLAAADGSLVWATAVSSTYPVFGAEAYIRRLEGANAGKFVHISRKPGAWSPIRAFVGSAADGSRATCVGGDVVYDPSQSVTITAYPDTLTFTPLPPAWETLSIVAESDTNRFAVRQFCGEQNCPEICGNGRDDDGDNYVDCYDTDCPCEQLPLACTDQTIEPTLKGRIAWSTPTDRVSVVGVPLVGNLNPLTDSIPEIIVSTAPSSINSTGGLVSRFLIFRGDGSNANAPQQIIVPETYIDFPMTHPTIADLDNDGRPEFIVMNSQGIVHIFTDYRPGANPAMKLWATSTVASQFKGMRLYPADFDHDGISELYSGNNIFWLDFSGPGGPVLRSSFMSGFQNLYGQLYAANQTFPANSSLVADIVDNPTSCTICPSMEIAAGEAIFSVEKQGDNFVASLASGNTNNNFGYPSIAAVQSDGVLKSVIPGINTGIVTVLGATNTELGNTPTYGCALICITNVYDDLLFGFLEDLPEILMGINGILYCLNAQAPGRMWWKTPINFRNGLPTPFPELEGHGLAVTAFDFNGDGYDEIVLHDSTHLRVLYGGPAPFPPGVDAERNWFKINAPSLPFDNYPVIADVDGDLEADIVYTTYASPDDQKTPDDRRGRLVVVKSDGGQWYPARPVWNQFSYLPVAIHDDLTVPRQQQPHQMPLPAGTTNRPLNKNQAQLPLLDSLYRPYRPLMDLSLRSDSSQCIAAGDSIRAWFTLCNAGEKPLPDSLPIALYSSDPTTTNAPLIRKTHLVGWLRKGQCRSFSLDLPATFGQPVFVVANDDGTRPRPFNTGNTFPARRGAECGYADNIASSTAFYVEKPLDLGPDLARCGSSTITLRAGGGYAAYRWQNGSTDSTLTVFSSGKYWAEVRDRCGKTYSDTLLITLDSISNLMLPQDVAICTGDSTRLLVGGSGLEKIAWSPAAGLSCTDCPDPVAQPTASTTYTLTLVRGECVVTDTVRVAVQNLTLDFFPKNPSCDTPGSLEAVPGGDGPFQFKWSNGSDLPAIAGLAPGTYTLTLTNALGCALVGERALTRIMPAGASVREDSVRCYGQSDGRIRVTGVTSGLPPFAYSLDGQAFQSDSIFEKLPAATYLLTVRDANGCTWAGPVDVLQPSVFEVTLAGSNAVIPGLPFPLAATVVPASAALQQIRWEPASLFPNPNSLLQTLSIQQPTAVVVTVTDWRDCSASDTLDIGVDPTRFVFFPNIIAPDGGGGLAENERFTAYGSEAVGQVRWLRVFDRWGNLLFERANFAPNDPQLGWDGRFQGKKMPPGVYVWAAEVEFTDGERRRWEGEVGVVR